MREYRSLNCLQKGREKAMSRKGFKNMTENNEVTGDLGVMRGRGRKWISNETVQEVAFAVVRREFSSQYFASSSRASHMICLFSGIHCGRCLGSF